MNSIIAMIVTTCITAYPVYGTPLDQALGQYAIYTTDNEIFEYHLLSCGEEKKENPSNVISTRLFSLLSNKDGTAIIAGDMSEFTEDAQWLRTNSFIMKLDSDFNQMWCNKLGAISSGTGAYAIETFDQNHLLFGGDYIAKIDSEGALLWEARLGGRHRQGYGAIELDDGTFVITGNGDPFYIDDPDCASFGHFSCGPGEDNHRDIKNIKIDADGHLIWEKSIARMWDEDGYSIMSTSDGGFFIAGRAVHLYPEFVYYAKVDSTGELIWEKSFGGYNENVRYAASSIIQTNDGQFLIAGDQDGRIFLLKIDLEGETIWQRDIALDGRQTVSSVLQMPEGDFILVGTSNGLVESETDNRIVDQLVYDNMLIIKTDDSGQVKWTKQIGGNLNDTGQSITINEQKEILIGGYLKDPIFSNVPKTRNSKQDFIILALDQFGNILERNIISILESPTFINTKDQFPRVFSIGLSQNYPNPFNSTTTIRFSLPNNGHTSLELFDTTGRKIETLINTRIKSGTYSYSLRLDQISSGIYFYRLRHDQRVLTKKLIKLK